MRKRPFDGEKRGQETLFLFSSAAASLVNDPLRVLKGILLEARKLPNGRFIG